MILWFIWRGYGFLVPIVTLGALVLVEMATGLKWEFYYQAHGWPKLLGFCLAAPAIYLLARYYDSHPAGVPGTGDMGRENFFRARNSFIFIPMKYWPYLLIALGVYFSVQYHGPTRSQSDEAAIERKTFSMRLPKDWAEDTKDEASNPGSIVTFQGPRTCLFVVITGQESEGVTVDNVLKEQYDASRKRFTMEDSRNIHAWSKYHGKGFELEGRWNGRRFRTRAFGFQQGENIFVIVESGAKQDLEMFADDAERIRQTFKPK